ncbi:MAG TPA: O-antigen ligase family protein [Gemmatimonadaceae bacterium]|jgi:O-antigen ligase|nr:O-antigen ligase family protein [Gemmatimonadaceae bacterium]
MDSTFKAARDPFRIALFLLTVLTVSRIHEQYKWLSILRPALVATAAAAIYAYLRPQVVANRSLFATVPSKVIAAFGIWSVTGVLFGISFGNSANFVLNVYVKTLVFAYLLIASVRSTRDLKTLVWAYVIATLLLDYTTLYVFKLEHYGAYDRLANADTYDANDLGLVLIVGLVITLLAFTTSGIKGKLLCIVIMCGVGAGIAKTGSRGAFVGMVAAGVGLLVLLDRVPLWQRLTFIGLVGVGLSSFAPPGYWGQMATILDPKHDYNWDSVNGRRKVAQRGIGYMMSYPIFGLGIHNFAHAECFISEKAQNYEVGTGIRCTPPHNAYIEAGAEMGLPGMALWLFIIPGGVIQLVILRQRVPKAWARGDPEQQFLYCAVVYFAVALLGYAFGSFFLSFAWTDISYYLMAMMAGVYICVEDRLARDRGGEVLGPGAAPPPRITARTGWRARESEAAVARRRLAGGR